MKKAILLSGAVAVVCLTLVSCGSSPESTTTTTRQTTVTAAPPPPAQTTTTTTHMSGGYWVATPRRGYTCVGGACRLSLYFEKQHGSSRPQVRTSDEFVLRRRTG